MTDPRRSEAVFTPARLARLAQIEGWHFWFVGRRALVYRLLRRYSQDGPVRILDAGCGTGFTLRTMEGMGYTVIGMDLLREGLRTARRSDRNAMLAQAEATSIPLMTGAFGIVLALDVLEHVADEEMLREVRRVLQPGGIVILSAPALPGLWSFRDRAAGHRRRYRKHQLRQLLERSSLRTLDLRYYQFLLLPLVFISRWLGRSGPTWRDLEERRYPVLSRLLAWINRVEVGLGDVIPWPLGSSLVAVGCKDGE